MYILEVTCNDVSLNRILYIVKNVLNVIDIITPIVLIIMLSIHFTRATLNPDDKKKNKRFINSIIALVVIFMLPVLVNVTMHLVGEKTVISSCWINATKPENPLEAEDEDELIRNYEEPDSEEKETKEVNPEKYPQKPPGNE